MKMLSVTTRSELLRAQRGQVPLPNRAANRAANGDSFVRTGTTGSGDDLLVLRWTAADLARERAAGARVLASFGICDGMRVANTLAGALVSPGSLLLGDVIEEVGGLDVPLGFTVNEAAAKAAWELIDRVYPEVLVVDGLSAAPLFATATATPRPWLQGVVWLRTVAHVERVAVPSSWGFQGWQRGWLAVAEVSSFVAAECKAGYFHVDRGVVAEVVDCQLVLTPVDGGQGITRYATTLSVRAVEACSCGLAGVVLDLG